MVTLKDLSKVSGFSVTTVSKALNDYTDISFATKEKIKNLADEMGYIPNVSARSLVTQKTYTIGIIFEEITGVGLKHPLFSSILENFKNKVEQEGYDIMFLSRLSGVNSGSYLEHSKRKQVEAILVLCAEFSSVEMDELFDCDIPSVVIDYDLEESLNITSNNEKAIFEVIAHLFKLGHRKIANIHGSETTFIGNQRKIFFEQAMTEFTLEIKEEYQVNGEYFSQLDGYKAMNKLLKQPDQPTAIFCASDMLAIGALKAINESGKSVPEDYSLVGFDGTELGQLITPRLTTIKQNAKDMGEIAAINILDMVNDKIKKSQGERIVIDTELIIGESTRKL